MCEIWKPIDGFDGIYSISEYGNIRREVSSVRYRAGMVKKPSINRKGYLYIKLSKDKKAKAFSIAKLVAMAFIGNRPEGFQINHKDGNKQNNHFSNLEYVSCADNVRHAWRIGLNTPLQGTRCGHAKLTDQQVLDIRSRYSCGDISQSTLAKIYNVNQTNIGFIVRREHWRHI